MRLTESGGAATGAFPAKRKDATRERAIGKPERILKSAKRLNSRVLDLACFNATDQRLRQLRLVSRGTLRKPSELARLTERFADVNHCLPTINEYVHCGKSKMLVRITARLD